MRRFVKLAVLAVAITLVAPAGLLAGFGRIRLMFEFFATAFSLLPGIVGDYLRIAFYWMTLEQCSLFSRISFGSFFAQRSARVGRSVYIGSYCVLGKCDIGDRTQIATAVQILSGSRQHGRDASGQILSADESAFTRVRVGADCWIGAAAVIMADVGPGSTIGAGSVVTRAIAPGVVAAGVPARVLKPASGQPDE